MSSIALSFEKLSRFERKAEPCTVAIPFPEGSFADASLAVVFDGERALPTQSRVTASWPEGGVKWLLVHFLADLPGNAGKTLVCRTDAGPPAGPPQPVLFDRDARVLKAGGLSVQLGKAGQTGLLRRVALDSFLLAEDEISGPDVLGPDGREWSARVGEGGWELIEDGPVRVVVGTRGRHVGPDGSGWLDYAARVYAFAGKPWVRLDYQVVHRESAKELRLEGMRLALRPKTTDRACIRTALATSNYGSRIRRSDSGEELRHLIDAEQLVYEANEQVPEVLYGTFWADWTEPERGGVSVTIHQAQQNFPKSLRVSGEGLETSLLPEGAGGLVLIQGVAKTHRMFLHLHGPDEPLEGLNVRSLQFQMPDRPTVAPDIYRHAKVFEDIWVEHPLPRVERSLIDLADNRTRGYGILHWGDAPDANYTAQGRGRGELVWTNNEYDLPHAALLMYARTGERRMLDYVLVAAEHWMDVDVCHHSDDPLRRGGQIVHSARHVTAGVTVSHEWVEGLLDYYHQTGEAFARETALGIGENVLRHLERPALRRPAGASARETGWALRTLVALYLETHDEKWMAPAEFIVGQFEAWREEYGAWLAPYTDHTLARVPFMIAIAANSLWRYYRVRPEERVGGMIVSAMRDMVEHCLMPDGRFYYKELPSLQRRGAGMLVLEALAHAYEISGDGRFLEAGLSTFELAVSGSARAGGYSGPKYVSGDAVIWPAGPGSKSFAAAFPPAMAFYRAAVEAGMLTRSERREHTM